MVSPSVSAVIPAYNAARTIARAVDSVLAQTWQPIEIIIVDDGSTDDTLAVIAQYAARGVRVVGNGSNGGAASARNLGIEHAGGEFVAFLDADDEWLPEKISRQMSIITGRPDMSFVACMAGLVRVDGRWQGNLYQDLPPVEGAEAWRTLLAYNFVATPTVLARRSALLAVGGFDTALPTAEDQDLWIRLALHGEIGFLHESHVIVHAQAESLSSHLSPQQLESTFLLVNRHLGAHAHRLTRAEKVFIRGHRLTKIGRIVYHQNWLRGFWLIARAILLGHKPLENIWYLVTASAPARAAKTKVGHIGGRPAR